MFDLLGGGSELEGEVRSLDALTAREYPKHIVTSECVCSLSELRTVYFLGCYKTSLSLTTR